MPKYIPVTDDALLVEHIGVGVHTGLRKGSDAEDAPDLWAAILESKTSAWSDAVRFCLHGPHYMGYEICETVEEE